MPRWKIVWVVGLGYLFFPQLIFAQMMINEFSPASSIEWIEFYNTSNDVSYLKNYFIDDDIDFTNDSGSSKIKSLSNLSTENINFPVIDNIKSFLNNGGDYVVLFDAEGKIVDQYQYFDDVGSESTWGRYPDGGGEWMVCTPTKQASNQCVFPSPSPTLMPLLTPTAIPKTSSVVPSQKSDLNSGLIAKATNNTQYEIEKNPVKVKTSQIPQVL